MKDENGMNINESVRQINGVIREVQMNSIITLKLIDVAQMMEESLPDGCSSDGIHFVRPKGME